MASGKYEKKAPARTIKTYQKTSSNSQERYNYKKQKYIMHRKYKQKIFALLAAGLVAGAILRPDSPKVEAHSNDNTPAVHSIFVKENQQEVDTLEIFEQETVYTIGIANYDAEITVDGKNYPIGNSFVISSGEESIVSDVHGNFLKGHLADGSFKIVTQKTESELESYNYFQVISDTPANVRASGEISNENVISSVPSGDYVLASKQNTPEYDGEWLSTLSINDGHLYEGYMREDVLQEIGTIEAIEYRTEQNMENLQNLVMVDTSKDKYISLNLRSEPGKDVLAQIPYGSLVEKLGETMQYGNKSWNLINYTTPDGTTLQGWVATKYLTNEVVKEQPGPKVINGIHVNSSGTVTGIDISTLSPDVLRDVLQNGISEQSGSVHGTFDTSQVAGKVNYVYIKLGASTFGRGDFSILDYDNYVEQVAICEELGVPYGFYYYSTAINEKEAIMELDCIKDRIEGLRQIYDMDNNLLEIAVDIELTNVHDRQYQGNIHEQTQAKALLINGIQELGLSENVLIYGPGRVMQPDLDQIFDLEYLNTLLSNPENVNLWQCSLMNQNGKLKANLQNDIAYGEQCGFSTASCQSGLDIYVRSDSGKVIGLIDINQMSFEHFNQLTNNKRENDSHNYFHTLELTEQDSQNEKTTYSLEHRVEQDDELEI